MKKGDKIAAIGLLILGTALILFTYSLRTTETAWHNPQEMFFENVLMMVGGLFVAGTSIAVVVARLRLRRSYQGSLAMIFIGGVLSAIPMVQTYGFYGYNYNFTTFPFSFIGYPLIALGFAIIFYSFFTNHLRVEVVQNKEDNRVYSTAKVVWKENNESRDAPIKTEQEKDINEQLMKQHTLFTTTENETTTDTLRSIHYCRYCGKANKNDASYCEKCGKNIE